MRKIARSIIVHRGKLLVIKRSNNGAKYYVLPGGGIDEGETAEQAAEREVREEASIKSHTTRKVYEEEVIKFGQTSYFLSEYVSGEPKLDPDSVEAEAMKDEPDNTWEPMWLEIDKLSESRLLPTEIHNQLVHDLGNGFSEEVLTIHSEKEKL